MEMNRRRRKNNILIGVLCCALVFMGIGYALLNATLTISSTATASGEFNVEMIGVSPSTAKPNPLTAIAYGEYSPTTISEQNGVTTVTLNTTLQKPGDSITYTITVMNKGTVKARYAGRNTIADNDYVSVTTDLDRNPSSIDYLDPEETATFTVTVALKDITTAQFNTFLTEDNGTYSFQLTPRFEQYASAGEPIVAETGEWKVGPDGAIISYPSTAVHNGVLTIPATTETGEHITKIGTFSFSTASNAIAYITDQGLYVKPTTENENDIARINAFTQKMDGTPITDASEIPAGATISSASPIALDTSVSVADFDPDEPSMIYDAGISVRVLDISHATYLTTIADGAFINSTIEEIRFNNAIESIGEGTFMNNKITSLTIPSSLVEIGMVAFHGNNISTLNLSNATSLETIGESAFYQNNISSLDFSNATNLETIDIAAFLSNNLTTVTVPSTVTNLSADAFDNGVTVTRS